MTITPDHWFLPENYDRDKLDFSTHMEVILHCTTNL
uniref:Uncharacterized protein n=1 Tax=Trichinella nativa TaxID=6335 RepID=A0A0V1KFV3_9BILA